MTVRSFCGRGWAYRWGCDEPYGHETPHHFVGWMFQDDHPPHEVSLMSREQQDEFLRKRDEL